MNWTKEQSTVVALWVLSHQGRLPGKFAKEVPPIIMDAINQPGAPTRSLGGVIFHAMGYERLFSDRDISITVTKLQREVAGELACAGICQNLFACS